MTNDRGEKSSLSSKVGSETLSASSIPPYPDKPGQQDSNLHVISDTRSVGEVTAPVAPGKKSLVALPHPGEHPWVWIRCRIERQQRHV